MNTVPVLMPTPRGTHGPIGATRPHPALGAEDHAMISKVTPISWYVR